MSRIMKFDGKPPLAKSPIRLRPHRSIIQSNSTSLETPLASYARNQGPSRYWDKEDRDQGEEKAVDLPPEYKSISTELLALANMVKQDFGNNNNGVSSDEFATNKATTTTSPLFVRGRFYDLYSARRNERLKRKKIETGSCYLGVNVETSKRHCDSKRYESGRKSMSSIYSSSVDRSAHPRYSLRSISTSTSSCKENQKPPLAARFDKAAVVECGSKIGARRGRKI